MKQTKQGKRLIAAFLSLGMLVTLLPVMTMPVYAAPSELPEAVAAIFEPDETAPADFNNAKDPYGLAGTDKALTISAFSELTYSITNEKTQKYMSFDTFQYDIATDGLNPGFSNDPKYFKSYTSKENNLGDIRYIQSDAADLNGDGTKESAVYVGLQLRNTLKTTRVVTWFVNMETGMWSDIRHVQFEDLSWFNDFPKDSIDYQALNFMSIAAGDFNGDGKDTWFVYYPGGGEKYGIYEFTANPEKKQFLLYRKKIGRTI